MGEIKREKGSIERESRGRERRERASRGRDSRKRECRGRDRERASRGSASIGALVEECE